MHTRTDRLSKFFNLVIQGKKQITDIDNVKRLLEAIYEQPNKTSCIERIIASPTACDALQVGLRFNVTPVSLNETTVPFIHYLADPAVKKLCNGQFLQDLLLILADPKTIWNAFMAAFMARELTESSIHAFAWMLVELLSLPSSVQIDINNDARRVIDDGSLFFSPSSNIRALGYRIQHILTVRSSNAPVDPDIAPGGRHDNDFPDFRSIAIYPTCDEFMSTTQPFYRRMDEISAMPSDSRIATHLDNQFRLMREDMLSELRDDIQIALGKKKGQRFATLLAKLSIVNILCGDNKRVRSCSLAISCEQGLDALSGRTLEDRKVFLKENRNYLRHNSFGCLMRNKEIIAFATLDRNEDKLASSPPVIVLRILGEGAMKKTLISFKAYRNIRFLLVDAPVFAYEPILRCLQDRTDVPLSRELVEFTQGDTPVPSNIIPDAVIQSIQTAGNDNIQNVIGTQKPISLDLSQLRSFVSGLSQRLSLIQGPPGTGKSFIGALLAKLFHDRSEEKILVMCYTNHALDQFLEDLLDIGISSSSIVRLGSKSTARTAPLSLSEQRSSYRHTRSTWDLINKYENEARNVKENFLSQAFSEYQQFKPSPRTVLEYLEFEDESFYEAFLPPEPEYSMTMIGENQRKVDSTYLYDIWSKGKLAPFEVTEESRPIWAMTYETRQARIREWTHSILEEKVSNVQEYTRRIDKCQENLEKVWNKRTSSILQDKLIIGCTTTAAAIYYQDLQAASPGIVLLEEAGEILESHVLTALGPNTKHLILIGDHQQLRPKINNYALSVEKGNGYDLNRSLFERLVLVGYPHSTLAKQHRMCPEISSLVRYLTYPELEDAPKTLGRLAPRGLQDQVIFINHEYPETNFPKVSERRDEGSKGSKHNTFEVELILKIVRYLGQQGYGTDKLVVLTPYLGQLKLLRDRLQEEKENDPVLNDLDSYDLVRAGLLSRSSANHCKRPIRLSTIDNFQGEESDIVIATLTRSNKKGDIGFMAAPQRLNVLLSRARDIIIMVGNVNTFTASKKGKELWAPFIKRLTARRHLYDGLPVKCEQHPNRTAILQKVEDFDMECPDGGCPLPCGIKLRCGVHTCPYKCHQLSDHSKMECSEITEWVCSRGHRKTSYCFKIDGTCRPCNEEDRIKEAKKKRDMKLEAERERKQKEYLQRLNELQDEIAHERCLQQDKQDHEQRERTLQQHHYDLANLRSPPTSSNTRVNSIITSSTPNIETSHIHADKNNLSQPTVNSSVMVKPTNEPTKQEPQKSPAQDDWDYQKRFQGAQSDDIDSLMQMIGLEEVKAKFLTIKARVDTAIRQGVDLKNERFGSVLIGNPGTGKTTVARIYANFLGSVGVLPGSCFVETTGSELADEGVSGCQKRINNILNSCGGVLFIDEAYQLTESKSQGKQAIDYLLAEVENQTGKMAVILAGYRTHMEKLLQHNPGLRSRFPNEFKFNDYEDEELRQIFQYRLNKTYKGKMKVEAGIDGLYSRILSRRVGRGRGREGFANARAVENICSRIYDRQATRLKLARKMQSVVDDLLLTKEDLVGPEPSQALQSSSAWQELQMMIGLDSVKQTVKALLGSLQYNYHRELQEEPPVDYSLNRVFLGSPGTGKTSIAKLYGQILVDIGMLSNGELIVKNPAHFVGSVIGESEKNTKGILASTVGKVLVIDEAYGLFGGGTRDNIGTQTNQFKTAVVDTIVAEVQSTPGDDRCVLLLGYQDQMEEMFQNVNPGLSRRFPMDSAFTFDDFTGDELGRILDLKLRRQGFDTTTDGRKVALECLERVRNRPHFGNAGEIDNLLNKAKLSHQQRLSVGTASPTASPTSSILVPEDFDPDYDRGQMAQMNIAGLFAGSVGHEKIIAQMEGYCQTVKGMRELDLDPREQVPFNFLFRGPPGTGKTTTARKMGKVYYDMGILGSDEVVESSATDFVGQYIGHTGPKTQELLEKALGRVLLIDEAYRLADGQFAKEAMDEIVDCITKPKFAGKLFIILAGYDKDINRLTDINPGLTSRFPDSIEFDGLNPDACLKLLRTVFQTQRDELLHKRTLMDISCLEGPTSDFSRDLQSRFLTLTGLPNWANGRDIKTLANSIFGKAVRTLVTGNVVITERGILTELDCMIKERKHRLHYNLSKAVELPAAPADLSLNPASSNTEASTNTQTHLPQLQSEVEEPSKTENFSAIKNRDAGITDEVWNQLIQDKQTSIKQEGTYRDLLKQEQQLERDRNYRNEENEEKKNEGTKQQHEQERLQRELERQAKEEELRKIRKIKAEMEAQHKKEQQAQKKLREKGVCIQGFRWIKQAGGYRCAGGSHYVSDGQLGI